MAVYLKALLCVRAYLTVFNPNFRCGGLEYCGTFIGNVYLKHKVNVVTGCLISCTVTILFRNTPGVKAKIWQVVTYAIKLVNPVTMLVTPKGIPGEDGQ